MASNTEPRKEYRLSGTFNPFPISDDDFGELEDLLGSGLSDTVRAELQEIAASYLINKPIMDEPVRPTETRAVCLPVAKKGEAILSVLNDIDDTTLEKIGFAVDMDIIKISEVIARCRKDLITITKAARQVELGLPRGRAGNTRRRLALTALITGRKNIDGSISTRGLTDIFEEITQSRPTASHSDYHEQSSPFARFVYMFLSALRERDLPRMGNLVKIIQRAKIS